MSEEKDLYKTVFLKLQTRGHDESFVEEINIFPGMTVRELLVKLGISDDYHIMGKKYYMNPNDNLFEIVTDGQVLLVFPTPCV